MWSFRCCWLIFRNTNFRRPFWRKVYFHNKGCAPGLVLKQRQKATRKWLIKQGRFSSHARTLTGRRIVFGTLSSPLNELKSSGFSTLQLDVTDKKSTILAKEENIHLPVVFLCLRGQSGSSKGSERPAELQKNPLKQRVLEHVNFTGATNPAST